MKHFILLKQTGLIFFSKNAQPQQLAFPKEAVRHQEIVDQKLFEATLTNAFSHFPKQEAVIFLSDELVFSKSIPMTPELVVEDEMKKFVDAIPFTSDAIEKKHIPTKTNIFFFAANSDLYNTVVAVAQKNTCTIKNVVPLSIFGPMPAGQQLSYDTLARLANDHDVIKKGDLMQKLSQPKAENNEKKPIPKQLIMLLVCLLIFGGVIYWALSTTGILPSSTPTATTVNNTTTEPTSTKPTQSSSATQTSPTTASVDKGAIKIQILNASGVAGLAGKIGTQLATIGFSNTQTGNAATSSATTTVSFADTVPQEFQDEITEELKKSFTDVDTQKSTESSTFDVSITTGANVQ
jgi:hypothetical protein